MISLQMPWSYLQKVKEGIKNMRLLIGNEYLCNYALLDVNRFQINRLNWWWLVLWTTTSGSQYQSQFYLDRHHEGSLNLALYFPSSHINLLPCDWPFTKRYSRNIRFSNRIVKDKVWCCTVDKYRRQFENKRVPRLLLSYFWRQHPSK